jgi:glycosyltransferase involved in cell wall biosynthesis
MIDITVIIPCYNRAKRLPAAIRSVLNQRVPIRELLVIDDGSTDESADIAQSFGPPVRVIRTTNRGLPVTRNASIAETRSEWIAFLDSDDVWHDDKLTWQVSAIQTYPEAAMVFCDTDVREGEEVRIA